MSLALTAPDAFTSNLKLTAVVAWPDLALTPLISVASIDRELFTSPRRKPRETEKSDTVPFTPLSETVTRLLLASVGMVTTMSLLAGLDDATTGALLLSTTVTVPVALMA